MLSQHEDNMPRKKETPELDPREKPGLDANEILGHEFDYIANSAFQANEDRSKAASFFLVSVGSLIATIFGSQEITKPISKEFYLLLAGLFLVITFLGWLTLAQLIRLRSAWVDAAKAMNKIKDYYASRLNKDLEEAFHWKLNTLPRKFKVTSIAFYTAVEVAILSATTFGAGIFFLIISLVEAPQNTWALTITAGLAMFLLQILSYGIALRK